MNERPTSEPDEPRDSEVPTPTHVAFVCVENAGRSQMGAALAERVAALFDEVETEVTADD